MIRDRPITIKRGSRRSPLVISIPHAGTYISEEDRAELVLSDPEIAAFSDEAVDWHTDELFDVVDYLGGSALLYHINRIVTDPVRYEDDADEPMSKKGLGAIYERTYTGETLRTPPSTERREQLLANYFRAYHRELDQLVSDAVQEFGYCVLVDGHSFGSIHIPSPFYDESTLPDLCLGTDSQHSPETITAHITECVNQHGLIVQLNHPYSGVVVPLRWYKDSRVIAYMFEINKRCYLQQKSIERGVQFTRIKDVIRSSIEELVRLAAKR